MRYYVGQKVRCTNPFNWILNSGNVPGPKFNEIYTVTEIPPNKINLIFDEFPHAYDIDEFRPIDSIIEMMSMRAALGVNFPLEAIGDLQPADLGGKSGPIGQSDDLLSQVRPTQQAKPSTNVPKKSGKKFRLW